MGHITRLQGGHGATCTTRPRQGAGRYGTVSLFNEFVSVLHVEPKEAPYDVRSVCRELSVTGILVGVYTQTPRWIGCDNTQPNRVRFDFSCAWGYSRQRTRQWRPTMTRSAVRRSSRDRLCCVCQKNGESIEQGSNLITCWPYLGLT